MREVLVNGRWPVLLPEHRAARPEWPWHEAARFAAMHHALAPMDSPVLWDVGAELGDHAAVYARWGCRLVLIEPNPSAWPCIAATIEANDTGSCMEAWCWAFVGDVADPAALVAGRLGARHRWPSIVVSTPCTERAGMAHLSGRPDPDPTDDQPMTTIDALIAAGCPPPDALTIDVEGAELLVLRGATQTLAEHRPLVWLSRHPALMLDDFGHRPTHVNDLLELAGYDGTLLATDHEEHWQWIPRG